MPPPEEVRQIRRKLANSEKPRRDQVYESFLQAALVDKTILMKAKMLVDIRTYDEAFEQIAGQVSDWNDLVKSINSKQIDQIMEVLEVTAQMYDKLV